MKGILYLDLETYCEVPISHGTYRYAESAEILLFAYAIGDREPVLVRVAEGEQYPNELLEAIRDPDVKVVAHNSMFDRTVLNYQDMRIPIERWEDTMIQAFTHGLPGSLDTLCTMFKVDEDTRKLDGRKLIHRFTKPQPKNHKIRRATKETHPHEWEQFCEYAIRDIPAMRAVRRAMPKWNYPNGFMLPEWHLDQKINDRGFTVDTELALSAQEAIKRAKKGLADETYDKTSGEVQSTTQRDALLLHIFEAYGISLPDLKKDTLERRLNDPDIPEEVKELLRIRQQASMSSTSKYVSVYRGTNLDGRCRGTIQYAGAKRTARAAGRMFQPQNLPSRGLLGEHQVKFGIAAMKAGVEAEFFPDVMKLAVSSVRGLIVASKGKKLFVSDLSNIEGRGVSWVSGEDWKIKAFKAYDQGIGHDIYKLTYAEFFKVDVQSVNGSQRQIGKVCLGGDTRVLTGRGWIPIREIKKEDKVWDGVEWVAHKGLINQGVKTTINLAGIKLTEDHLILTGRTWKQARQLASNEKDLFRALETASGNIPSPALMSAPREVSEGYRPGARAGLNNKSFLITWLQEKLSGVGSVLTKNRIRHMLKNIRNTQIFAPTNKRVHVCYAECPRVSTGVGIQTIKGTPTTEGEALPYILNGLKIGDYTSNIYLLLKGMMTHVWKSIELMSIKGMNRVICGLLARKPTAETNAKSEDYKTELPSSKERMTVYDLACSGPRRRFTVLTDRGPLIVHNCELMLGYEGGVGAFLTGAATYGFSISDLAKTMRGALPAEELEAAKEFYSWGEKKKLPRFGLTREEYLTCDVLKRLWRKANPNIAKMWRALDTAITKAIANPDKVFTCGRHLQVVKNGVWLRIILPSGRSLCYPGIKIEYDKKMGKDIVSYLGHNQYGNRWERIKSYGGKWLENVTQAIARDGLYSAMQPAEDAGFKILTHVHDELVTEAEDNGEYTIAMLDDILATNPSWAEGLPLAAEGFEDYVYHK